MKTLFRRIGLWVALASVVSPGAWRGAAAADEAATAPSVGVPEVRILWGATNEVFGDLQLTPGPAWYIGAARDGGEWLPAYGCWYVPAAERAGRGALYLAFDPALLTNSLALELALVDSQGAELFVDLVDSNCVAVVSNLFGNLTGRTAAVIRVEAELPLDDLQTAPVLRLRRGAGEIVVGETVLRAVETVSANGTGDAVEAAGHPRLDGPAEGGVTPPSGGAGAPTDTLPSGTEDRGAAAEFAAALRFGAVPAPGGGERHASSVIYVDCTNGSDTFSGRARVAFGQDGPKRTVAKGLDAARSGDTLVVVEGQYEEDLNAAARGVDVVFMGNVRLGPSSRAAEAQLSR